MIDAEKFPDPQKSLNFDVSLSTVETLGDKTKMVRPVTFPNIGATLKTFKEKEKKDV